MNETLELEVIRRGHALARKIRHVQTKDDLERIYPEISTYVDWVDDNYGEPDDLFGEKGTSLSTSLMVAYNWYKSWLHSPKKTNIHDNAQGYLESFEEELDEKEWAN